MNTEVPSSVMLCTVTMCQAEKVRRDLRPTLRLQKLVIFILFILFILFYFFIFYFIWVTQSLLYDSFCFLTVFIHLIFNIKILLGAVLFKESAQARQIALLYQRYKKFDQTSYSISNVTFYNLFAAESVRMGR